MKERSLAPRLLDCSSRAPASHACSLAAPRPPCCEEAQTSSWRGCRQRPCHCAETRPKRDSRQPAVPRAHCCSRSSSCIKGSKLGPLDGALPKFWTHRKHERRTSVSNAPSGGGVLRSRSALEWSPVSDSILLSPGPHTKAGRRGETNPTSSVKTSCLWTRT